MHVFTYNFFILHKKLIFKIIIIVVRKKAKSAIIHFSYLFYWIRLHLINGRASSIIFIPAIYKPHTGKRTTFLLWPFICLQVDIYFNFIGKVNMLEEAPEPTPEEIAAAEKLQKQRERKRANFKRYIEKRQREMASGLGQKIEYVTTEQAI